MGDISTDQLHQIVRSWLGANDPYGRGYEEWEAQPPKDGTIPPDEPVQPDETPSIYNKLHPYKYTGPWSEGDVS